MKSIDGVRAISMMWVMIAHLWTQLAFLGEQRYALDILKNGEWSFITSGTPSVDRPVFKLDSSCGIILDFRVVKAEKFLLCWWDAVGLSVD